SYRVFVFSSRRRHTRSDRDWSSDVLLFRSVPVVVVNPTAPIGEQDIKPTPTGRIVVDFLKRKFPAYVDTGLNVVDVREVARGHRSEERRVGKECSTQG